MSYVDGYLDREKDKIFIVERINGKREYREYPVNYTFYFDDVKGKYRTIYDTPVSKFSSRNSKEFHRELKIQNNKTIWESDINPIFRCLSENYQTQDAPKLQTAFFDIEVDFDPEKGFSTVIDPFNKITAISIYLDWLDQLVTLSVPPKGISWETATEIQNKFTNCFIFKDEVEMINTFLDLIDDADILSGWNSEGYDIPYIVMRMNKIMSKDDTRRLCLWGQKPKQRMFERFGAENLTFDLVGRVHMDYMQLYRKFNYEERHSYSLDFIGQYELKESKVVYDGTLDQLYNNEYAKFLEYNRQDTMILAKLDKKLRFIDLANTLAHDNTVLLQTTMGAVAVTEQAIINSVWAKGLVVPNRKKHYTKELDDETGSNEINAPGAYVAYPKIGMHKYIGAIDIKSLYPSTIRALNMGPETIIGQLRPVMTEQHINAKLKVGNTSFAAAWEGLFGSLEYQAVMNLEHGTEITIDWENGESTIHSAAEVWKIIFEGKHNWILSANGTIFRTDKKGIVPKLLEDWYNERIELQKKKKAAKSKEDIAFWDKRQLVKKINLNSLYGAILNPGCRFFDIRIGSSTTLTGRCIAKHMAALINEEATGKYDHQGDAIIYGDTDSCYFSLYPIFKDAIARGEMQWSKEICIEVYNELGSIVNSSFPGFMEKAFHCPRANGALIQGDRETAAITGLFIKKKRYGILLYEKEGKRLDVNGEHGDVKAMGLDLKRSDTPKIVQDFLSELLKEVLIGATKDEIVERIKKFKIEFETKPAWEKGTPKRVNNLTSYGAEEKRLGKANMPGHVRAALNWNRLKKIYGDNYSMKIVDGMKVIVCKLKENPIGFTSVAYPIDEQHIPQWFKDLPFDDDTMESTIVDKKIDNLLGVLKWDLEQLTQTKSAFNSLFSFE